jgi:hypothetical protein
MGYWFQNLLVRKERLSIIYRDQPPTPLEQAVFWTEYVIRRKRAPHVCSVALDLNWYQYFLLDVIAVLASAVGSVLFTTFLVLRTKTAKLFGGKNEFLIQKRNEINVTIIFETVRLE